MAKRSGFSHLDGAKSLNNCAQIEQSHATTTAHESRFAMRGKATRIRLQRWVRPHPAIYRLCAVR